ncbi:DNA-processing protein DprA [Pseudaeromonas paramecii]|uniref:DNA-processing protein DprA n=1 Tax=Pseudaeromonas paramecii TaxID=2138166 RepID=A0ABP8Q227_9GAMM
MVTLDDPAYPLMLRETVGAPLLLFVQGRCEALSAPLLAVVGSRQPTPGGRQAAQYLGSDLVQAGLGLCSGLALGIDGVAHQAALQAQGLTVAVLGTGLAQIYPRRHVALAQAILEQGGALVSEFWPDEGVRAENFPRRNRIISGLSMGTLVVEAAEQSGSLITARFALEQGRELFAVPGSWQNPQARGCHRLIQQGAKLVCCAADILEELGHFLGNQDLHAPSQASQETPAHLPTDNLLDNVGYEATDIDTIAALSRYPIEQVMGKLIELELLGWIASVPGGYVRTRRD